MTNDQGHILVVDDSPRNRLKLCRFLQQQGHTITGAENGRQALAMLTEQVFDLMLLDIIMPEMDGYQVLEHVKQHDILRNMPVIVISALDEMESAIKCIAMGAEDYLPKPFDPVLLEARIGACLEKKRLRDQEVDYLRQVVQLTDAAAAVEAETFESASLTQVAGRPDALGQLARVFQDMAREVDTRQQYLKDQVRKASKDRYKFGNIIGRSPAIQAVYEQIVKASASDANVVICGESGTGKELVAHTIHELSERKKQAFVAVNCGAVPETLFESEFFGHRKGAFTGATMDKKGFFDRAHKGTLFLDEVGELSLIMQVKLLRALQDKEYIPLGATVSKTADVRIIAATNKDLIEQLHKGFIREDFFYRIRVTVINLPPLRERKEDIPLLIDHFLEYHGEGDTLPTIPGHIMEALCAYDWPGNIRELQNELQRYLTEQELEFIGNIHAESLEPSGLSLERLSFNEAVEAFEKSLIAKTLAQNAWHQGKTAAILDIPPRTLYRKIRKYHLIEKEKD